MKVDSSIGVIFDMDGVLVDSAPAHLRSWRLLAGEHGRSVTDGQFAETFGRRNGDIIPVLFGQVSAERLKTMSDRKEQLYRDLIRNAPQIVEGAVELIDGLHRAGARLAVGSSGPLANIELVLHGMGAADRMTAVVSGDDVTHGKPDPQVFMLCAQQLGLSPSRCVVVEDAPVGVQAARSAGMKSAAILIHHPVSAFSQADYTVPRLADLTVERLFRLIEE